LKKCIFSDFDAFSDAVRDVDCTMLMQNPRHREWRINHVYLPDIHVQVGRLGSGNIVQGEGRRDGFLFYLPLSGACEYSANGKTLPAASLMILDPGCDFCISTDAEHDWCTIFVPTGQLMDLNDSADSPSDSREMQCWVSSPNRRLASRFGSAIGELMNAADNSSIFESTPAAKSVQTELVQLATELSARHRSAPHQRTGRPQVSRDTIINRCMALIESAPRASRRVDQLAAAAGVSERTLRTVFHEYYGVGPHRYLLVRQLNELHCSLRAADPKQSKVSDLFVRHGVWQFGRITSQYRRLFGELPSQTLHRG